MNFVSLEAATLEGEGQSGWVNFQCKCRVNIRCKPTSLGGQTPSQYAKQLASKVVTMPDNSKALCY
jgi:hypothetical protein